MKVSTSRVGLVVVGFAVLGGAWWVMTPDRPAADGPTATAEAQVDLEGKPELGKWRRFTHQFDDGLTEAQRAEIAQLEAIGYLGTTDKEAGRAPVIGRFDPQRAHQGLNLYNSGHRSEAFLVDMQGEVLHQWSVDFFDVWPDYPGERGAPGTNHFRRAFLRPNGDLVGIFEGVAMLCLDKDSNVKWALANRAHHDAWFAGDGTIWTLTREARVIEKVHATRPTLEDFITVLTPDGELVRQISLIDAFLGSDIEDLWDPKQSRKRDVFHTNSIEVLDGSAAGISPVFAQGNVLISSRTLSKVAIVDPASERVVWATSGTYKHQHDAQLIDGSALLLFDNDGLGRHSRVMTVDLATAETTWQVRGTRTEPMFSALLGTAQRLPNGNTLVVESEGGRALEYTPEKEVVWEFFNPHRAGKDDEFIAVLFDLERLAPDAWRPE